MIWLCGYYLYNCLKRGSGGGERRHYLIKLLSGITGEKVYLVGYCRGKEIVKEVYDGDLVITISIPISSKAMAKRGIFKVLNQLRLISKSDIRYIFSTEPRRDSLTILKKYFMESEYIVVDSISGYSLYKNLCKLYDCSSKKIIYLSYDYAADFYSGNKSFIEEIEEEIIRSADYVIVSSRRDLYKYQFRFKNSSGKIIVFPNIFIPDDYVKPDLSAKPRDKLVLAIIEGSTGVISKNYAEFLARSKVFDRIIYVGRHKPEINSNLLNYYRFIGKRSDLIKIISRAHIGINYGLWSSGSNTKKYDYALAGLTVLSGGTGARGEYIPGEIAFIDEYDLISKITMLDIKEYIELGRENLEFALSYHEKALEELKKFFMMNL